MRYLSERKDVNMMTWETNPAKRNKNNEITFIAKEGVSVKKHDVIDCVDSFYRILEIVEQRKAALNGYINYRATTQWADGKFTNL